MLESIYQSGDYPFIYTALVGDANLKAYDRLSLDYNFGGYPSCFFDAGYSVFISGTPTESYFRNRIENAGSRPVSPLDMIVKLEWTSSSEITVSVAVGNGTEANTTPYTPSKPLGPSVGEEGIIYEFETQSSDQENNTLWYQFNWGDENLSSWIGPFPSGEKCTEQYSYSASGTYNINVRTKDLWNYTSDWSASHQIVIGCCQGNRGNVDSDILDETDIADLVYFVTYSFNEGPEPACLSEADVDASSTLDIGDIVYLVSYMFGGGPPPLPCN